MKVNKSLSRFIALVLSIALVLTMRPVAVSAETEGCTHEHNTECGYAEDVDCSHEHDESCGRLTNSGKTLGESGDTMIVAAFDKLEDEILRQDFDLGGIQSKDEISLPDTLTGTDMDDNAVTIDGVTWQSAPDFNPEAAGTYRFSPKLSEEYELAAGVTLPVIIVMLGTQTQEPPIIVAEFDELDEYTLYQGYDYGEITSQDDLILPDTLTGKVADGDPITIEGVIWQSDPEFDPAVSIVYPGYIFSTVLPEGYALAEGATAPVISVIIRPEDGMPINPTAGADALVSTINAYSDNNKGSRDGFTAVADGNTVTVTDNTDTGSPGVTGATNQLVLTIDSGVTVVWKATISGSGVTLISLSGTGTFEVASGGTIMSGWGAISTSGKLEISGGTVISTAGATMQAPTIRAGNGSVVTVKSGAVTSDNYFGINVVSGAVVILQGGAVNGAHSEFNAAISNSGKLYYLGNTSGNNGIYITASGTAYYIGGNSVAARFTNNSGGNLIALDEPTVTDSSGTHNGSNPATSYVTASFPPQLDLSGANISITPAGTPYTQVGNDIRFTADMNANVTVVVNGATIDNMTLDTFTASFKVYIDGLGENVSDNIAFENKAVTYGDTYTMAATINGNTSGFSYTYVGISGTTYPSSANAPTNAGIYRVTAIYSGANNETGIATATLTIERKPITGASVTTSQTYTYNGSFQSPNSSQLTVILDGQTLSGTYDYSVNALSNDINAGTASVTVRGEGNYTGTATGNYTINPKPITISNVTATDRDYNGTATVELTGGTLSGVITGDSANVGFTLGGGTMSDATAGSSKSVTTSITLTGSAAGNYTLTPPTGITVNISRKSVTINGLTAGNKVYDGNAAATVNGTATLSDNYDGANLTISEGTAAFDSAGAGTGKTVTFSNYSLDGSAADNYTLSAQPTSVTANITQKELTITGFNITKVYDGYNTVTGLGTLTFSGLVNGETATVDTAGVTATYAAATVGTHNITFSGSFGMASGGTATAGNYTITQPTNITGTITKSLQTPLTITDPGAKTYGSGTFTLTTSGGDGTGAVTYTITSGNDVISITGSTVTILKVGTATVTATKAGDNDYEPTTSASITITVNKATGSFGTVAARNATYTPTLTLQNVALPSGYVWDAPGTSLSAGDNQSFAATYTDPSGNYEAATGNIIVNVAKATQSALSITGLSGPYTYGDSAITLGTTGGTTSGTVTYVSSNTAVATVSGNTVNIVGVGNFAITATMAGNSNYNDISVTSNNITVNKADQTTPTISDGNINKVYGDSAFSLSMSGGESTGAYSYISSNTNVATVDSSGLVTITGVGTTTLSVKKLGDGNYNDSASASATLTVSKATLTGTVTISGTEKFGQTLTATPSLSSTPSTTLGTLTYQWKRGSMEISGATGASYTLVQTDIGQTITVTVTATNCMGEVTSNPTATIGKADAPTIQWPMASGVTYGQALSASTLSFTSNEYGTFAWTLPSTIPTVGNSGYSVIFTQTNDNYEEVTQTTQNVTVAVTAKNVSSLTIDTITAVTYTGVAHEPVITVKDGDATLTLTTDYTVAYSNNINAGTATLTITGRGNYDGTKQAEFTINKATPDLLEWPTASVITYGAALSTSTLNGGVGDGTWTWTNGTIVPPVGDQSYNVTFTPTDTDNYDWSGMMLTQDISITVSKASSLSVITNPSMNVKAGVSPVRNYSFDMNNIPLNKADTGVKTYSASVETDISNILSNIIVADNSLTYDIASTAAVGDTATITITINTDNYTSITATLTITVTTKDTQTIKFEYTTLNMIYGYAKFTETAMLDGNGGSGAVTYTSDNINVATVNATTGEVTIVGAGFANITAKKSEDADWFEATASYTLIIAKADQLLTAADIMKTVDDSNTDLSGHTASSADTDSGVITYTVTTAGAGASISGTILSFTSVGMAVITATAAGSTNYNEATTTFILTVTPPPLVGTATISGTNEIGQTLIVNTGSITGAAGNWHYAWFAGSEAASNEADQNTLVISGADAGKIITCVITSTDASGSITAAMSEVVPYNIVINNIGSDGTDNAVTLSPATGRANDTIALSYILGNGSGKAVNILTFTGCTGLTNVMSAGAGTSQTYTVTPGDAVNGVITITATFLHTDLQSRTLSFSDTGPVSKVFGNDSFTNAAVPSAGSGTITYTSSVPSVATVDSSGTVTIRNAGQTTITAGIASDTVYAGATVNYTLTVTKASQTVPSGIGKTDETAPGANDGTMTGVTTAMEYKRSTDTVYTPIPGTTVTELPPETYYVRYAATANHNPGPDTVITIAAYTTSVTETPSSDSKGSIVENNYYGTAPEAPKFWGAVNTDIEKDISTNTEGSNHNVVTGRNIVVPTFILETLQDSNTTLAMHTGMGVTFSITGSDIPDHTDTSTTVILTMRQGELTAPEALIKEKTKDTIHSIEIPMESHESFGMTVNIHFSLGAENADNYANLYRYNEQTGTFDYLGSYQINEDGQAMFGITGGADFLLTVTTEKPDEVIVPMSGETYIVKPGDTLSGTAVKYGVSVAQIMALNPGIKNSNRIRPGQKIRVR